MRSLIIMLIVLSSVVLAVDPPQPIKLHSLYIGSSFTDMSHGSLDCFAEFPYAEDILHTFLIIQTNKWDKLSRSVQSIGVILPLWNLDVGMGIGNVEPDGRLFLTYLRYQNGMFDITNTSQFGETRPIHKVRATYRFFGIGEANYQYITNYGNEVGLSLNVGGLILGSTYHLENDQWLARLAIRI